MVNKKAYMRTLEVFMAVLITFIFVIYVVPTYYRERAPETGINILNSLEDNLRDCANTSCVENAINSFDSDFGKKYNYIINISSDVNTVVSGLPAAKKIFSDSVFIAGNSTSYDPRIIRLYYWYK